MTKPGDSQTKKSIHELAKEFPEKTYRELEKYRDADRQEEAGACIIGEARKDREITESDWHPDGITFKEKYNKEHKLRQEAEGELIIIKGIGNTSPEMKDAKAKIEELQEDLNKIKKENNDLYNRIAELIEANEKEVKNLKWIKDHDYIFLVDENKKLHEELKKLKEEALGRFNKMRKSGF